MILQSIILGFVEGITEFIPVSSTAHLLLVQHILGIADTNFWQTFTICIQVGSIMAAVWFFWDVVWSHRSIILKVIVGFIPTGIAGLLLYPLVKTFFGSTVIIAIALIVGGVLLITLKPDEATERLEQVTYKEAFWIGVAQIFSIIPGMSRSGATLIGGTWLGIPRSMIVSFSFVLGIPTILGATVVQIRHVHGITGHQWALIALGTVVAFIVAVSTIKYFIRILTKKPLAWFGWYRIAVGIVTLLLLR